MATIVLSRRASSAHVSHSRLSSADLVIATIPLTTIPTGPPAQFGFLGGRPFSTARLLLLHLIDLLLAFAVHYRRCLGASSGDAPTRQKLHILFVDASLLSLAFANRGVPLLILVRLVR